MSTATEQPMISATIITLNEAACLQRCLASAQWMDELVVVDSGSGDATCDIARQFSARVIQHNFEDFGSQKNFAAEQARHDWIFSIDADEEITPALAAEIRQVVAAPEAHACYAVPRENIYFGKPLRHVMGIDAPVRLYRKSVCQFDGPVHEKVVGAEAGRLENNLRHYSCETFDAWQTKHRTYLHMDAKQKYADGRRCSLANMVAAPAHVFLLRYLRLQGFRDGYAGFRVALEMALSAARYEIYLARLGRR
ncbi:MAG: glycosyltransferase family 2 protein [Spartobacteria bacterium]|nr:glycosyltransferase family 2 protein [Spartobacteria bacterium]